MIVDRDEGKYGEATATFSDDRRYRYSLTRRWSAGDLMLWIMLNPSTADAFDLDPTLRRCVGFARRDDYSGIMVVNLYALRSSKPEKLLLDRAPIGEPGVNKAAISDALRSDEVGLAVAAWGAWWSNLHDMAKIARLNVEQFARAEGRDLVRLGRLSKHGAPRHPLYVHHDDPFLPYVGGELLIGGTS